VINTFQDPINWRLLHYTLTAALWHCLWTSDKSSYTNEHLLLLKLSNSKSKATKLLP